MYKKILIKSVEDLPKKYGRYHTNIGIISFGGKKYYNRITSSFGKKITYYLLPIESPISVPTEEEKYEAAKELKIEEKGVPLPGEIKDMDEELLHIGFIVGAKWAIDEIIKRNK